MEITNELVSESFSFAFSKKPLTGRTEEQLDLDELLDFCQLIEEKACYDENLLEVEVEEGIFLYEILYGIQNGKSKDGADFIREMFQKKCRSKSGTNENTILCSIGSYEGAVGTRKEYAKRRQVFLRNMKDYKEYGRFMFTCFPNSVFAKGCEQELAYIKDFADHVDEITDCLSLLDEEAVPLYHKYHSNLQEASNILQTKMKRTCAPDPKHRKQLLFEFTYEEESDGRKVKKEKMIECQPHFKLIHDGSNLRVYFWWKDKDVGDGKRVLIGRVGRHPWSKI